MLKPEHLDPLRDALRSLGDRLRRWLRKPDANDWVTEGGPLEPKPIRTWASIGREVYRHPGKILLWLFLIYIGVGLIYNMVTGSSGVYGASFGFGNLYINYSVAHGGLLGDRLEYAVILQDNYPRSSAGSAEHKFTFVFPGDHLVIVQPRRGETVWVDGQYQITRLGRVLRARDFITIARLSDTEKPTIRSPEEFLALVMKLRTEPGAPAEPPWATGPGGRIKGASQDLPSN